MAFFLVMFVTLEFRKINTTNFQNFLMTCGGSSSEGTGNRFNIGSNLKWVLLTGRETGLVYLHTQL